MGDVIPQETEQWMTKRNRRRLERWIEIAVCMAFALAAGGLFWAAVAILNLIGSP